MRSLNVKKGKDEIFVAIESGRGLEGKSRQSGIMPGERLRVLHQAPFCGLLLVLAGGREIALGRGWLRTGKARHFSNRRFDGDHRHIGGAAGARRFDLVLVGARCR